MTWLAAYVIIQFWLPLIVASGLVVKGYQSIKSGVSDWANSLLDNHMTHIQSSAEAAAESLKAITEINREFVITMKSMRDDFQKSQVEVSRAHTAIMTGIEILKDRE